MFLSGISQMQVRFDPLEDRLLLRVRGKAGEELRFWLTRRYVGLAWPALRQRLEQGAPAAASTDSAAARRALASFEHENAVQAADFSTPYAEQPSTLPLGDAPVLLSRFSLREGEDGGTVLALHPQEGHGVDLALSRPLLHSFCKLLTDAVARAGWAIDMELPGAVATDTGVAH